MNNPPSSGPRVGNAGFVEVIVTRPRPTWFMQVLGIQSSTVKARAVAGLSDSSGCVYALNRDTSNSNNGIFVTARRTRFSIAASTATPISAQWAAACVVTPSASYSGTYTNTNGSDPNCGPDRVGHGIPAVDPMAGSYTMPSTSPCTFNNYKQTGGAILTDVRGFIAAASISVAASRLRLSAPALTCLSEAV